MAVFDSISFALSMRSLQQIIMRTIPGRGSKLRCEVHSRQASRCSHVSQTYWLSEVRADIFLYAF